MQTEVEEVKEKVVTIRCRDYVIDFWKTQEGEIIRGSFFYEGPLLEDDWIPRDIYDPSFKRAAAIFRDGEERKSRKKEGPKQGLLF